MKNLLQALRSTALAATLVMGCASAMADTPAPTAANDSTPKAVYDQYRKALAAAENVDAIVPFMCKKVVKDINTTAADVKPMLFGLMKEMSPATVQVLKEEITGDKALMLVTGKPSEQLAGNNAAKEVTTGKVTFVKEDGQWKIDKESWETKMGDAANDAAPVKK